MQKIKIRVEKRGRNTDKFFNNIASHLSRFDNYKVIRSSVYKPADIHIVLKHAAKFKKRMGNRKEEVICCELAFYPHYERLQVGSGCDVRSQWWKSMPYFQGKQEYHFDNSKKILVVGQRDRDFVVRNKINNPGEWKNAANIAALLSQYSDRIVYRSHPRATQPQKSREQKILEGLFVSIDTSESIQWNQYNMMATINSTTIYESLMNGVPCVTTGISTATVPNICLKLTSDNAKTVIGGLAHKTTYMDSASLFVEWIKNYQYSEDTIGPAVKWYIEHQLGHMGENA